MRRIIPYEPTWLDKSFRKALKKVPEKQRQERLAQLASLLEALQACDHPALDPRLERWRPSKYSGSRIRGGHLVEYRFPGLMRVVACYFDDDADILLLLTATLNHDHQRMTRLIRQHETDLSRAGGE